MQRSRLAIVLGASALALAIGFVAVSAFLPGRVFAGGPPWGGAWHGGPPWAGHGAGAGFELPPELAGLRDVPENQRFAHFTGARVNLTDAEGQPVTVEVTPGTATAVSATSLTIAANDGASRTFSLDDTTAVRGKEAPAQNDRVVVVTLNSSATAEAVMVLDGDGFGPWGGHAGWGR